VDRTASALLSPAEAAHPVFSEFVDLTRQAEIEVACGVRALNELRGASRKKDVKKSTSEAGMSFRISGRILVNPGC
jgi:hypothetical protein